MASCFLANGIVFGIINTFGILFVKLKKDMEDAGVEDAATKCGDYDWNRMCYPYTNFLLNSSGWIPYYWHHILLVLPCRNAGG